MSYIRKILCIVAAVSGLVRGTLCAQGFSPEEAVQRMQVPPGFQVKLVACEPEVRQPVTMTFDDRGRLWVIQYLQYPNPAGLKPVTVDQYLRTVYDRVPEPPPKGPRGADGITILEDTHGDGRFRKVKDFVTGLNLASGMALGYGGVFVAQPPYLLFYPDRNGDDIPDGDPEVLLSGFGMQDAHAFPNSLQWGPDGWLYGAQGSTVTSHIRGITFQQGIWRYHPITKEFELFAEGGGNTWGLDFDAHGNAIAGTNFGDVVCLHQVQGAYYVKNFSKHGELQNPYAFGYFGHVPYTGFKGGHVTCGGILYRGGAFSKEFDQVYIAANPLANAIYWHRLEPKGSSFTARFGGELLLGNDTWFRPVDLEVGPDGSLFVADWYDKRINHVDPVDNWDRSNGRIYRIKAMTTKPVTGLCLSKLSSAELVGLLSHRNDWFIREARRILAERRDPTVIPLLRKILLARQDPLALEALWALYVSGGFNDSLAENLLGHAHTDVRAWTVRLLGDAKKVSPTIRARFIEMARSEPSCTVRSQLACTCKRLPGKDALPIVRELLSHSEDAEDPHIPLLLWWAIEDKAVSDREAVLELLASTTAWQNRLLRQFIVERLARRYMAAGTEADFLPCARLLAVAPGGAEADLVLRGMEQALEGRKLTAIPNALENALADLWSRQEPSLTLTCLGLRLNQAQAQERALRLITDSKSAVEQRTRLIEVLGQTGNAASVPALSRLLAASEPAAVQMAALSALQPFPDRTIAEAVLAQYPHMSPALRGRAQTLLCSRPASTRAFLDAMDRGRINPKEVPFDQVRRILLHNDTEIRRLVEKHWGQVGQEPPGEKRARINSVKHMLGTGSGDPHNGKRLFQSKCATCHTLFGEGTRIGPDLTGIDRRDRDFLVTSVVDPSAVIRNEYVAFVVATTNGRILNGLVTEATPKTVTLVDGKNERLTLARQDIEEIKPSSQSLMPEKLLDDLDEQQIRDLFAYLQSEMPSAAPSPPQRPPYEGGEGGVRGQQAQPAPPAKDEKAVLKVCLVSGSVEYKSDESLAALQKYLEEHYPVRCTRAFRKTDDDLPGLENLATCDVVLLFTRRLTISGEQLERIKKYCLSGKPIVAVCTASHAFQNWLALDKEVLGGNYQGHYPEGPITQVAVVDRARGHPILAGVEPFQSAGSLYKNTGLAADAEVLLTGSIPGHTEPIAWTRIHNGGRIFYTSLGHPQDFRNANFLRLLTNALFCTAKRSPLPHERNP
jgi:putative membrane-bound dehydrogenase-like protein